MKDEGERATLRVEWTSDRVAARASRVPVELRDANFVVRASGLTGREISAPAGTYFVRALLPTGEEIFGAEPVVISAGQSATTQLTLPVRMGSKWPTDPELFAVPRVPAETSVVRLSCREPLLLASARWEPFSSLAPRVEGSRSRELRISPASEEPSFAHITSASEGWLLALPRDSSCATRIEISPGQAEMSLPFELKVSFEGNPSLDDLYSFAVGNAPSEARALSADILERTDEATSPLERVLAAYILLRSNSREGIALIDTHFRWTESPVPDAYAIRVEMLARSARHEEALRLLDLLPTRPLPWFSSGVSYLAERLTLYRSLEEADRERMRTGPDQPEAIRGTMGLLASALEPRLLVAVFRDSTERRDGRPT